MVPIQLFDQLMDHYGSRSNIIPMVIFVDPWELDPQLARYVSVNFHISLKMIHQGQEICTVLFWVTRLEYFFDKLSTAVCAVREEQKNSMV